MKLFLSARADKAFFKELIIYYLLEMEVRLCWREIIILTLHAKWML